MAKENKTLLLLDANALLHRAWHALPPTMKSPDGTVVNAVYGFSSMLMKLLAEYQPDAVAACFDVKGPTFRHKLAESYKATREKKPDELYAQIALIKTVLEAFGIPHYENQGYEADDYIGTISAIAPKDYRVLIVTGDQDEMQLIDERVHVLYLKTGISNLEEYGPKEVKARFGFEPEYLADYKALRGDTSDNIKGVQGIGEKSGAELIAAFHTVEEIYKTLEKHPEKIEAVAKSRALKALQGSKEVALAAKKLTVIVRNAPIDFKIAEATFGGYDRKRLEEVFMGFGFRSLVARIPGEKKVVKEIKKENKKAEVLLAQGQEIPKWLFEAKRLAFFIADGEGGLFATEKNLGVATADEAICLPLSRAKDLKKILENKSVSKVTYRAKELMHDLNKYDLSLEGLADDVELAAYLIEAGTENYHLDALSRKYLGQEAATTCSGKALLIFGLAEKLKARLEELQMTKLYQEMELPLVKILFEMEQVGIKVDTEYLKELSRVVTKKLQALEKKILKLAGVEFNINSPSQLAEILFDRLGIPSAGLKKTKTGISTAAPELEKIAEAHPIVSLIFDQREMQKLLSTYIDVLPTLVKKDGRIHTTYEQAVTSTGRLSSNNPNMQNIPIQGDLAEEIRKAFVAERGMKLVAADYSQIQLRIAASLSRDKHMVEAFKTGKDIHAATAARIFSVPENAVTSEQRRQAKVINFGILYGMGANALARGTGMTLGEARTFIVKYFEVHPGIRSYMEETKLLAKSQGYVETLFGRRRYFPDIHSGIPQLAASAERMAMNMPIQGAEADLMKLAMLEVQRGLREISKEARLLLQVHDELVLEVPEKDVKKVSSFLKESMENVAKLEVPIIANVEVGDNWGEMNDA